MEWINLFDIENVKAFAEAEMKTLGLSEWEYRKKLVFNAKDYLDDERKRDAVALLLSKAMKEGTVSVWGRPWLKGEHFYRGGHEKITDEYFMGGEPELVRNDHLRIRNRPDLREWHQLRFLQNEVKLHVAFDGKNQKIRCATDEEIANAYIQKFPIGAKRQEAEKYLRGIFPMEKTGIIRRAIAIGNSAIGNTRGRCPKLS